VRLRRLLPGLALVSVASFAVAAVADGVPTEVDAAKVKVCMDSAAPGTVEPDCVGLAADECMVAPPRHQTTIDIFECREAEETVWRGLAHEMEQRQLTKWRQLDQFNRDLKVPNVSGLAEQSFETLRDAYWVYAQSLCYMIYHANEGGSIKNILSSECQLKMAAAWALRLRDTDWSYGENYRFDVQ